ncbi:MAG: hypothetical protein ABW221_17665 [Vicinamibacteria bacterium]
MRKELLPPLACGLAALAAALLLRRGIVMGPDSWAYWEASVSLRERGTYGYFGGQRVDAFPPLFAAWLAAVQAVLGVSARSLIASQVALAGCAAWQWTRVYLAAAAGGERAGVADVLAAAALAVPLAVSAQTLLSESLWLVLLPVALRLAHRASTRGGAVRALGLGLAVAALLLCRNVTVAFLPALGAWAVLRAPAEERARRAGLLAAALGVPVAVWIVVRRTLGQAAAHAMGSGSAGLGAYLGETAAGVAEALGPARLGIGALLLAASAAVCALAGLQRSEPGARSRALSAFVVTALFGQAALFASTYVAEGIRGRFVVFAALVVTIAVLAAARSDEGRLGRAALGVGAALASVALLRLGVKARLAGVEQPTVAARTTLSSAYWSGPPRPRGTLVLVAPPTYPWLTRPVDGGGTAP